MLLLLSYFIITPLVVHDFGKCYILKGDAIFRKLLWYFIMLESGHPVIVLPVLFWGFVYFIVVREVINHVILNAILA